METISGVWVFNDTLSFTSGIKQSVRFTTNNEQGDAINVYSSSIEYNLPDAGKYNMTVYGRGNWANTAYKTIDFGTTEQTVTDSFYTWLTSNAVQQGEDSGGPSNRPSVYLIRSNSTLYTITDGTLTALAETEITASLFQTYGVDNLPDGSLLVGLTDPEVLYWHDSADELPVLTLTVRGTPPVPQVVVSDSFDMSDPSILGIESATITSSSDVLFALSFDDGATWKAYDGTQWVTLEQQNSGMTAETFQNIPLEAWAGVVTSQQYRVRFVLMDTTSYMTSLVIHYIN